MNRPPAFQLYADDLLGGTMHFTDSEVGLYTRLLCVQWNTGSLPDDDNELSSYGKGGTPIERVKLKFRKCADGRLRNTRMEIERKKQKAFRKSRSNNGKLGGRPRLLTEKLVESTGLATHKAKKSSPSPVSVSSLRTPIMEENTAEAVGRAFIEGWCQNYKARWQVDYKFQGGRDGKSVKELMSLGILPIDLLEIAKKAWAANPATFETRQAATIHGFRQYFNQLNIFSKNGNSTINKPNPRNVGIIRGRTDYATAKPRLQRELESKAARLAGQVAPAQDQPPSIVGG